jgi:hypothetical protein
VAADRTVIRARVRKDLHDEDSGNYRWTDSVLDRHIDRTVYDFSLEIPREQKTTLTTTSGSRDISISSLTNLIAIERVEWPTLEFPPHYVGFTTWQTTLTLDSVGAPSSVQNVFVYWLTVHTLDGSTSTIPVKYDELIAMGAAGYAALDREAFAIDRINTGGEDVWGRYSAFGERRLADFRAELKRHSIRNRVRQRVTYTTEAPDVFEQSRVKY